MEPASSPLIEVFLYPASDVPHHPLWEGLLEIGATRNAREQNASCPNEPAASETVLNRTKENTAQEIALSFETGREQGILEGRQAMGDEQRSALHKIETRRIQQAAQLVEQFSRERDRFLQSVEFEVARLALAIAARILRREAQTDPLFLTGAVRIALGQLAETTKVRLRVPATEAELWSETLEHTGNLKLKPTVIADENLHTGDCLLETELGSADLGFNTQLGEIERALFDEPAPDWTDFRTELAEVSG